MLRPLKAFQRCIPKWIHLKVLVSNCPADGRSGDLWLPCDGFMRSLIYWCIKTFFAVKIYLQVLHQVAFTGPKWGLAILLCIANTHIAPSVRLSYQTLSALFCRAVHIKKVFGQRCYLGPFPSWLLSSCKPQSRLARCSMLVKCVFTVNSLYLMFPTPARQLPSCLPSAQVLPSLKWERSWLLNSTQLPCQPSRHWLALPLESAAPPLPCSGASATVVLEVAVCHLVKSVIKKGPCCNDDR